MSTATRVAVLLAGLCAAASAARAQYPQRRDGFWIGFGLGYGSSQVTCDSCRRVSRQGGVTGFVKLGGAPRRNPLIGRAPHRLGPFPWRRPREMGNRNRVPEPHPATPQRCLLARRKRTLAAPPP